MADVPRTYHAAVEITRIGSFILGWGESVVWDDRRQRLYFVDCAASTLHWLDDGATVPERLACPSMPTGIVPTTDGRLVAVLDDGLRVVDPDAGTFTLLTPYPDGFDGRGNDACADLDGNIITGSLNLTAAPGSTWRFSPRTGWQLLDPDISNCNGPAVGVLDGAMTLIVGDTAAHYFSYTYEPATGRIGPRRRFGDVSGLSGKPDGATLDADGGFWAALVGGAQLVRFTTSGLDRTVDLPVSNPTDITFGGRDLDRAFVVSIAGDGDLAGALLAIDGLGRTGRPEPQVAL